MGQRHPGLSRIFAAWVEVLGSQVLAVGMHNPTRGQRDPRSFEGSVSLIPLGAEGDSRRYSGRWVVVAAAWSLPMWLAHAEGSGSVGTCQVCKNIDYPAQAMQPTVSVYGVAQSAKRLSHYTRLTCELSAIMRSRFGGNAPQVAEQDSIT